MKVKVKVTRRIECEFTIEYEKPGDSLSISPAQQFVKDKSFEELCWLPDSKVIVWSGPEWYEVIDE